MQKINKLIKVGNGKMKKEMLLNEIKELLLNDVDTLRDAVNELNSWNNCLDYLIVYENDEEFFDMFFKGRPAEVARAIHYGDFNYNDEYIKFNAYGRLKTLSEYDYEELLKENVEEVIDCLIEYVEHISIDNEELDDLLSQYFEDEE